MMAAILPKNVPW